MNEGLPSELTLLIRCARTHISPALGIEIQDLVHQPLDWEFFLRQVHQHWLGSLVYRNLSLSREGIPSDVILRLERRFQLNRQRNLLMQEKLIELNACFRQAHIPILIFKGALLSQMLYGDLNLRRSLDLDILVKENDVYSANRLLKKLEYSSEFDLPMEQYNLYIKHQTEQIFTRKQGDFSIDLHWSLVPNQLSFSPDPDLPWQQSVKTRLADQELLTFSPEFLLIYLCIHGCKHGWWRLSWICDVNELLRSYPDLNWDWILNYARFYKIEKMLQLGLYLVQTLFEEPNSNRTIIIDFESSTIETGKQVIDHLWHLNPSPSPQHGDRVYLSVMPSVKDRLWFQINNVITPTHKEWAWIRLPVTLFFLYYPLRILRLSWKQIRRIWNQNLPAPTKNAASAPNAPK